MYRALLLSSLLVIPGGDMSIEPKDSVGALVAEHPSFATVFEELGIDYCCRGDIPLEQACEERDLDMQSTLCLLQQALRKAPPSVRRWDWASTEQLLDHIEQCHHGYLKKQLPRLSTLLDKVVRVHGAHEPSLLELQTVFTAFQQEIFSHLATEERAVFPAMRHWNEASPNEQQLLQEIRCLEEEHDAAGQALEKMALLTHHYTPPADACNSYVLLLDGLQQLQLDMHQHVHKENSILFPRFASCG
jgi:regulator of cell morphogenesis and NO signaling